MSLQRKSATGCESCSLGIPSEWNFLHCGHLLHADYTGYIPPSEQVTDTEQASVHTKFPSSLTGMPTFKKTTVYGPET